MSSTMTYMQARKWAYISLVVGIMLGFWAGYQYKATSSTPETYETSN